MVSAQVRAAEKQIDGGISQLPIWRSQKNLLLKALVEFWRDGLEVAYLKYAHGAMFENSESSESARSMEHQLNTGILWSLKWTYEYSSDTSNEVVTPEQIVDTVINVGVPYQLLVDALKFAKVGGTEIEADENTCTLTVYEGGNLTGYDHAIVARDHDTLPYYKQTPLVEDSDQLTRAWRAGEYRKFWRWLRKVAEGAETETIVAAAGPLAPHQELFKRPVVLQLPDVSAQLQKVADSLTLTQQKIEGAMKWKIAEWQDCPLVQIGQHIYGVSSVLQTLADSEDHMLRVAVLNDREQYDKISGLREERMLAACRTAFEDAGWKFKPHLHLTNPSREVDGYATKGEQEVVIQLKSTLRPNSPWEVYKRNSDLIDGIRHTADVLHRFRPGALGFVVTDGYEGDYSTWADSLKTRLPIATLQHLEMISADPLRAFDELARLAGIEGEPTFQPISDRVARLCGWTVRLVDSCKPGTADQ